MRTIIWEKFGDTVYYLYFLTEYISVNSRKLETLELFAFIFTIAGIFGWLKTGSSYSIYWTVFLCVIQVLNFFRNRFMVPKEELLLLEFTQKYYNRQRIELENLWQDYHNETINEKQAEKKLRAVQLKEINALELYDHKRLDDDKINDIACRNRDKYLKRFLQ